MLYRVEAMRVTTDFFVSALMRRIFSLGGFAAVVNRGAAEAGAVLLVARDRTGEIALYGPAPQALYDEARPGERLFVRLDALDEAAAEARLARERRFDPDIWIVEAELPAQALEALIAVRKP